MATINSVEQRMEMSYDFNHAEDGLIYQTTVDDFMELLLNGQLQKAKHAGFMDRFVGWVSQDPHWELALPLVPELRENKVEEDRLTNFPKHDAEKLLHVQDLLDKLQERIHRPPTAEQVREQEEWVKLCRKAGVPGLCEHKGGQEDEEPMRDSSDKGKRSKEDGNGNAGGGGQDKYQPGAGMMGLGIVLGKPVTLGEVIRATAAANEKQEEKKEKKKKEKQDDDKEKKEKARCS